MGVAVPREHVAAVGRQLEELGDERWRAGERSRQLTGTGSGRFASSSYPTAAGSLSRAGCRSSRGRPSRSAYAGARAEHEVAAALGVRRQEGEVVVPGGVEPGDHEDGIAARGLAPATARPPRRQQLLRPDEALLALGVEDAAGEGSDDPAVGVGVEERAGGRERPLGGQRELAVGVVEDGDVELGLGVREGVARPARSSPPRTASSR